MKANKKDRILALLLAVVMVVGLLPMTALAARMEDDEVAIDAPGVPVDAPTGAANRPAAQSAAALSDGEETAMVAKAQLGTDATFGGAQVDLSNALYTFAANGSGYTVSAAVPGTETTVYLNIGGNYTGTNAPSMPNMATANDTPVVVSNATVDGAVWFRLKDASSLHFHRDAGTFYFNRCGNPDGTNHDFALFRLANEGETASEDIPGYVRLTAAEQVTAGEYLIAAQAQGDWYVLYPASTTNVSDKYVHVAKVVLVEETVEPEPPVQTYASPAEAEAAGKVVTYLSMMPNMSAGDRHWDGTSQENRRGIDLYQVDGEASSATTSTPMTKDIDGVDGGKGYAIFIPDSNKAAVMHYGNSVTNQCSSVGTTIADLAHLFVIEFEDGGYTIRPISESAKYLSLNASGSQQAFTSEKTTFYITSADGAANGGTYYIWTATDPSIGEMLATSGDANKDNTWAFVGGRAVQGRFADIGMARTLAGQFEEHVRWENRGSANDENGNPQGMQRYVFNTAYEGQRLADVVSANGWARVAALDPRAAVYMVGDEDITSATFETDLTDFVGKALALRDNTGFAVIIKGYKAEMSELNAMVDAVVNAAANKNRVAIVDAGVLTADQLSEAGYPNAKGHLALARKLSETVVGNTTNFPTSRNDADAIANGTWADRLTDEGVTVLGAAPETRTAAQQAVKDMVDASEPLTWLFMGDSITHGALWAEGDGTISQDFEKFVRDDLGRTRDIILNTAVSGATSATTVREIEARLNKYAPDVVSIMIGTNDAAGKRVSVADYKTNLNTILTAILNKNAVAVLRTPIPNSSGGRGENVHEYVIAIQEVYNGLTEAQKARVIVVDQFAQWSSYLMTADNATGKTFLFGKVFTQDGNGIHPGPVGHLWMTQELIDGLGLWDASKNLCKLSYRMDWGITEATSTADLSSAWTYNAENRELSLDITALGLSEHVISMELTVTVGSESLKASYLRGQADGLSVIVPNVENVTTASVSATALVSESAAVGKKLTFNTASLDLTQDTAHPKAPAPAELETVYEYVMDSAEDLIGVYGIYSQGNGSRMMYNSTTKSDHCQATPSDGKITMDCHTANLHQWQLTKQSDGTYTIQGVSNGKYLTATASGTQLALGDTAVKFTITHQGNGIYHVSNGGSYLAWNSGWKMQSEAFGIQFYKQTEVVPAVAQTHFAGSATRPMDPENPHTFYRIPSLITLDNGWLMASADIRWFSTNDSPNNLDTIVSISKDGGETWEYEVVNYLADYAAIKGSGNSYGPSKPGSASFIDPSVVQAKDGTIYLLVDLQPPYVNGGKIGNGFDSQGRLQISKSPVNSAYEMDNGHNSNLHGYTFDYYVDINNAAAGNEHTVDGETIALWPICANEGDWATGYYVDAFFNTYYDYDEEGMKPIIAKQHDSTDLIHNNIFYTQSEWKAFPTAYIMLRTATVNKTTGKLDWGEPKLLNDQIKHTNEHFIGVCPGRGITTTVTKGEEKIERIIFPLYDNQTGNELASAIYSDDGGATWIRGERTPDVTTNNTGKTSESQIVELPDGNGGTFLRMYSRNGRPTISYADSTDGGQTWSVSRLDNALNANNQNGQGCMVSFINVKGYLIDSDGNIYENLILASYPQGTANGGTAKRTNGAIRIGYYDPAVGSGPVTWLNEERTWFADSYIYSCLTQRLENDAANGAPSANFALLYETDLGEEADTGRTFTDIRFTRFDLADLLGEGWALVQEKPTPADIPEITVTDLVDMDVNTTETMDFTVTPANATVSWSSDNVAAATVADGVITAVGAGKAYITITATNRNVTKTAQVEVVVQDGADNITLPDRYMDGTTRVVIPETKTEYDLAVDGLESGIYSITAAGSGRTVGLHDSGSTTNQCGVTVTGNLVAMPHDEHKWTVTKLENGKYTIRSNGGKYLPDTPNEGSQLNLSDTAVELAVTHKGDGSYTVQTAAGKYLAFVSDTRWALQDAEATVKFYKEMNYVAGTTYTVHADGLTALIAAAGMNADDYADTLALAADYTSRSRATAAQAKIDAAAKTLYAVMTGRAEPEPEPVDEYTVSPISDRVYTGNAIEPLVTVWKNGELITEGFELVYSDNVNVGTATVAVVVEGETVATAEFKIIAASTSGGSTSRPVSRPQQPTPPVVEDLDDSDVPLTEVPMVFEDVAEEEWYYEAVKYVFAEELMEGVSVEKFSPDANTTRGMVVTILHRMEKEPEAVISANFADVADEAWYAASVAWGQESGVAAGMDDGNFHPSQDVTREQLVLFLYRFAQYKECNVTATTDLTVFVDGEATSDWAADAVCWAVGAGLLQGKGANRLDPNGTATRAEVATILMRFCESFMK